MRNFLRTIGVLTALLAFVTAVVALLTEGLKFYRENATPGAATTPPTAGNLLLNEDFSTPEMIGKYNVDVEGPWKIEKGKYAIDLSGPNLPWAATFIYPPSRDIMEWKDYSVEVDLMCEANDTEFFAGVGVRQGGENSLGLDLHWIANYVALARSTDTEEYHILKSVEFELEFQKSYHLKLVGLGSHIWAYLDNLLLIDYIDTKDTQQYYGGVPLGVYGGGRIQCAFDNLRVQSVVP